MPAQVRVVQVSSRHNAAARTDEGEQFGAPPPGDPGGGAVELDEQLFELVGVVALVTARAAAVLGHEGYRLPARLR